MPGEQSAAEATGPPRRRSSLAFSTGAVALRAANKFKGGLAFRSIREGSVYSASTEQSRAVPAVKAKLENTYRTRPIEGQELLSHKLQQTISGVLERVLGGRTYDVAETPPLCSLIGDVIKSEVKDQGPERYKYVCNVIVGERHEQGVEISSRCLWDEKLDNYACAKFENETIFAVAMVHGLFFE